MDYFTKERMVFIVVVLLVLLNMGTLGMLWMGRPDRGERRPMMRPEMAGNAQGGQLMAMELGLDEEQAAKVEALREAHFERTRPVQAEIQELRMTLADAVFDASIDRDALLAALGEKEMAFQKLLVRHFEELKGVCNEEQQEILQDMLRHLVEQTGPREMRRGPGGDGMRPGPGGPMMGPGGGPGRALPPRI